MHLPRMCVWYSNFVFFSVSAHIRLLTWSRYLVNVGAAAWEKTKARLSTSLGVGALAERLGISNLAANSVVFHVS